jgi:hypothetical protein
MLPVIRGLSNSGTTVIYKYTHPEKHTGGHLENNIARSRFGNTVICGSVKRTTADCPFFFFLEDFVFVAM